MFDPSSPFLETADPLAPAQKTSFAEERLKLAVQTCELLPGSVATEAQIADRFGIGRAGVRVALARLSAVGLVHPIRRAGWKVLPVTGALIGDIISARRQVEPSLGNACPDPAAIARMNALAEMIEVLEGQSDPASIVTRRGYEREMLDILMDAEGNRLIANFLSGLWDHSDRILRFLDTSHLPPFVAGNARALAEAAAQRDSTAIVALRMAEVDAFREYSVTGLMRNRTELGVTADVDNASENNGQQWPDGGKTTGTDPATGSGTMSNKGAT